MAKIKFVEEIDDLIKIDHVFATATDKSGLVNNEGVEDLPEEGLLGLLFKINPKAVVISTGGTARLISEAGYNVTEISNYTGWAEMETGLVKSMSPKLYVGMLAHPYTESDAAYMAKRKIPSIDMVLVNFYPFEESVSDNPLDVNPIGFEVIRQNMDVGGPTAAHTSRKGFLTTAVATRPEDYVRFAGDLVQYNGSISLKSRLEAMKHCSIDLARYHTAISTFMGDITLEDVKRTYPKINSSSEGGK